MSALMTDALLLSVSSAMFHPCLLAIMPSLIDLVPAFMLVSRVASMTGFVPSSMLGSSDLHQAILDSRHRRHVLPALWLGTIKECMATEPVGCFKCCGWWLSCV